MTEKLAKAKKVEQSAKAEKKVVKTAVTKKVEAPAAKKTVVSSGTIRVQQIRSGAGRLKNQIRTLEALGLGKINRIIEVPDNSASRGMVAAVQHLVKVL